MVAYGLAHWIDATAGDIAAVPGAQAAGSSGKAADAGHVHGWSQAASAKFQPADPSATASTTLVMMGLGTTCAFTPSGSGKVLVTVTGGVSNNTTAVTGTMGCRFGTGSVPANGAAVTGTRFGSAGDIQYKSNGVFATVETFAFTDILTLTPGTAYWFDMAVDTSNGADTAAVKNVSVTFVELPA